MSHLPKKHAVTAAAIAVVVLSAVFLSYRANAHFSNKVDPFLAARLVVQKTADVVVKVKGHADLTGAEQITDRAQRVQFVYDRLRKVADESQASLVKFLNDKKVTYQAFYITNAIVVQNASAELLNDLAQRNDVERVNFNVKAKLKLPPQPDSAKLRSLVLDAGNDLPSNLLDIHVDKVWSDLKVKGKGIVVAGQDSGYNWKHPAIHKQYRGVSVDAKGVEAATHDYNWHDSIHTSASNPCGVNTTEPCDDYNHGTHTMGSMVGDDGAENKIGVAPEAKWIGCRNMDNGVGTVASYTECFEFFLAPYPLGGDPRKNGRPDLAPHIINNSWGCPNEEGCHGNEFVDIVRAVKAAGIMVVVALGNDGPGCNTANQPPGSYYGEILAAGAYDHYSNDMAYFSSRGPSGFNGGVGPDIAAPGNAIRSSVNSGGTSSNGGQYDVMSGTSMASPHTVGVVALLWSAHPELIGQVQKTVELIHKTAMPRTTDQTCGEFQGSAIPNAAFGYGLIDAYKLITSVQ